MAVSMPAVRVLLRQCEIVGMLMISEADVKCLHALGGNVARVVGAAGWDVDFVGEEQWRGTHYAVAGVKSAGLEDKASRKR